MKDHKKIKSDEVEVGVFHVKYTLYEYEFEKGKILNDVLVDDILINDISIQKDLNSLFNTYKSSFRCRLIQEIEDKEKIYAQIWGGLSGYYE